jgi:hypothetical protein
VSLWESLTPDLWSKCDLNATNALRVQSKVDGGETLSAVISPLSIALPNA